jgi:hypothetical protein
LIVIAVTWGCPIQGGLTNASPAAVTTKNADDILCRMNAGTSRIYVPMGRDGQGFSDAYQQDL